MLEDIKAAIIIEEKDLNKQYLLEKLEALIKDDKLLTEMAENSKKIEEKNSLEKIKREIYRLAKK